MLRPMCDLLGADVEGVQGVIGRVADFIFDDDEWRIRYVRVDSGSQAGEIYLSTSAVEPARGARLRASVTAEQLASRPVIAADPPLSREAELSLHDHYGWAPYWEFDEASGSQHGSVEGTASSAQEPHRGAGTTTDVFLRHASELVGYRVVPQSGQFGRVADVLIDDQQWAVAALLMVPRSLRRSVTWNPREHCEVVWPESRIRIDSPADRIWNESGTADEILADGAERPGRRGNR